MNESVPTGKKRGRPSARDKILDAALDLVGDLGAAAVTLDAVAERAGVSKGGLLYHFPFKDQLLIAANEHLVRRRVEAREAEAERLPEGPTRQLKAYVLASVNNRSGNDQATRKLLAAGSMSAESAAPIRAYCKDRFPPLAKEVGVERAALVHAATEGLWFMEALGLSPFSARQRAQLVKTILSIVDGAPLNEISKAEARPGCTSSAQG